MPVASSNPRRKTCFPNITAVADTLGVRRETLYRALCGKTFNPELAGRYAAIVLPPLLAKLSGGTLPVGPGAAPLPRKRRKARPLAGAGKEEG